MCSQNNTAEICQKLKHIASSAVSKTVSI
jgi:hypothetical protein